MPDFEAHINLDGQLHPVGLIRRNIARGARGTRAPGA